MQGIIGFENHCVHCLIGIHPHERLETQPIYIDFQTEVDFAPVAHEDKLSNSVCYAGMAEFCTVLAQEGQHQMLEALAYDLVHRLVEKFKLHWAKIAIRKPAAIPTASFAFVELEYGKKIGSQ